MALSLSGSVSVGAALEGVAKLERVVGAASSRDWAFNLINALSRLEAAPTKYIMTVDVIPGKVHDQLLCLKGNPCI